MILIGLTGPPGSGKDTAYLILESLLKPEWNVKRYSFADPLRAYADDLMGLEPGHEYWGKHKDQMLPEFNYQTPRELLIDLGMLGRKYQPTMWVDKAFDAINADHPEVAIITDVRFKNEAIQLRERGGHLVAISRAGLSYNPELESESGQAVPWATHMIKNDGPLSRFQHDVEHFWWQLVAERTVK